MNVKLYVEDDNGVERFWRITDLADCFDLDSDYDSYISAAEELRKHGRVWIGGGAAQAYLAMVIR